MNPTEQANIATVTEAAGILGVNLNTLKSAVFCGHIPVVGRERRRGPATRLINLEDAEAYFGKSKFERREEILHMWQEGSPVESIAFELNIKAASVRRSLNRSGVRVG